MTATLTRGRWLTVAVALAASVSYGPACRQREQTPVADTREAAYRANNRGVALLERFAYDDAVKAFQEALAVDSSLQLAHVNLPIALFYAGRNEEAEKEARVAIKAFPRAPQPLFILGLLARGANRSEEAAQAFLGLLALDPNDVGAKVNLALTYVQQRRFAEAADLARSALEAEPYNATAAYNLGLALMRSGDTAEGTRVMARFEELRTSGYAVTYSQTYLEQGRYGEAIASTGAEPDLVSTDAPGVTFAEAAESLPAAPAGQPQGGGAGAIAGGVTLADLDRDGDLDLAIGGRAFRLLRNDRSRFVDVTGAAGLGVIADAAAAPVAADVDNDDRPDLLVLREGSPMLFAQGDGMVFREMALVPSGRASLPHARAAAVADVDHDGDLDILLGGFGTGESRLLQNNGNRTFTDTTAAAGLTGATDVVALAPTDFDNRRDVDLLIASSRDRLRLFRNLRTGRFDDVASRAGLAEGGAVRTIAVGDVNKDGYTDAFLGREGASVWAMSDGRGGFRVEPAPEGSEGAIAAQIVDYDNDGLLDLFVAGASGPRLFRSLGRRWVDETARSLPPQLLERARSRGGVSAMAAGDVDLDGDTDIAVLFGDATLALWRNEGGNRNRSLRVRLTGRVSNRDGVGAKVEIRAGSLHQRIETAATSPPVVPGDVVFGLGARPAGDAVRVVWPSGVLQAETELSSATPPNGLSIVELDRKPSSCPYLFTWNGDRFEFVTDFLGGGEMGAWQAPGVRNVPEPVEYVRITDRQLRAENGVFTIQVTNELEEALFLDHLELLAVTHPADVTVWPDEGLRTRPRRFYLYRVRHARPPVAARDDHDHDVLPLLSDLDRRYPDDFALSTVRGYAAPHGIRLTLGPGLGSNRRVLLLTGSTDYAFSSDNVAAHQAQLTLEAPALQIRGADGQWQTVDADVGFPIGRPQTLVVDVSRFADRELRLVTSMRVYWDQILVADAHDLPVPIERVPLRTATLKWRGFSTEVTPDGREPFSYDYHRVTPDAPWKLMPGRYTREGDVRELTAHADDRLVVSRPGDQIELSFDAAALAPLPEGSRRTFLLHSVGYSKEMNFHSASPIEAAPLPFRGMSRYPYGSAERYPHPEDVERFHTRIVTRSVPALTSVETRDSRAAQGTLTR